jgi:hypothetical protein
MVFPRDQPYAQVVVPDHKGIAAPCERSFGEPELKLRNSSHCWDEISRWLQPDGAGPCNFDNGG